MRVLLQRFHVRAALNDLRRKEGLKDYVGIIIGSRALFNTYYNTVVDEYITQQEAANAAVVVGVDDDGNPILSKILDFIKWMYESGFLEFLIGVFFGMQTEEISAFSTERLSFDLTTSVLALEQEEGF